MWSAVWRVQFGDQLRWLRLSACGRAVSPEEPPVARIDRDGRVELKTRPTDGAWRGSMPASCVLSTVARATAQVSGCEIGRRTASGPWRAPRIGRRISPCYRSSRSSDAHTRTRRSIAPRRRPMDTSSVSRLEIAPGDRLRERDTRHSPSRDGAADRSPVRYAATHRRFCDNVEGHPRAYATALNEPMRS